MRLKINFEIENSSYINNKEKYMNPLNNVKKVTSQLGSLRESNIVSSISYQGLSISYKMKQAWFLRNGHFQIP